MAQRDHISKLRQGVVAWNEWREQEPAVVPDLSGADLSGIDASAACFDRSLLRGATFNEARLREATFNKADLEEAKFEHADLYKAEFKEARARAANFAASLLSVAKFDNAILVGATFALARLVETSFHNAWMAFADLRQVAAKEAYFRGADLYHAYLSDADLQEAVLERANLREADLQKAKLGEADLTFADLGKANLTGADLHEATLRNALLTGALLSRANLQRARLDRADLRSADLRRAILREASLSGALLMNASLDGADLSKCRVFGISAWDVSLTGAIQRDLVFTPDGEPAGTVDDLEVAQFVYLLSRNEKIRNLLDTVTQKVVLILGRFTPPRLAVLNAVRDELRKRGYLPVVFTFEPSPSRNLTETIATLASLVRFVVADISSPKSIPQEMLAIAEQFVSVPIQPIILASQKPYALFESIQDRQTVLPLYRYSSVTALRQAFTARVVTPAESLASQIVAKRLAIRKGKRRSTRARR